MNEAIDEIIGNEHLESPIIELHQMSAINESDEVDRKVSVM